MAGRRLLQSIFRLIFHPFYMTQHTILDVFLIAFSYIHPSKIDVLLCWDGFNLANIADTARDCNKDDVMAVIWGKLGTRGCLTNIE